MVPKTKKGSPAARNKVIGVVGEDLSYQRACGEAADWHSPSQRKIKCPGVGTKECQFYL